MNMLEHVEITPDGAETRRLNDAVAARMPSLPRNATHLSDLLYCLLKAWGKKQIPESEWTHAGADEDDPLLMWLQGLQFEDLVAEGQRQQATGLCFQCRAVGTVTRDVRGREVDCCPACGHRWLVATPDYIVDGVIHESKQTRKSQRKGPVDAPWWLEQLASYVLFERLRNPSSPPRIGRLVVNWLMGDYGEKRKGYRPRPPRSALDAFAVQFPDSGEFWQTWFEELLRRKQIVERDVQPELDFVDSPRYPQFECASCPVGKPLSCPQWKWDDEDREIFDNYEEIDVPAAPDNAVSESRGEVDT